MISRLFSSRVIPHFLCRLPNRPQPTASLSAVPAAPFLAFPRGMATREEQEAALVQLFTGIGLEESVAK